MLMHCIAIILPPSRCPQTFHLSFQFQPLPSLVGFPIHPCGFVCVLDCLPGFDPCLPHYYVSMCTPILPLNCLSVPLHLGPITCWPICTGRDRPRGITLIENNKGPRRGAWGTPAAMLEEMFSTDITLKLDLSVPLSFKQIKSSRNVQQHNVAQQQAPTSNLKGVQYMLLSLNSWLE